MATFFPINTILLIVIIYSVFSCSAQVSNDDLKKFADANNKLAADLFPKLIHENTNNFVFCPASLMTGLGIMLHGARGNTEEELYSVLGYKVAGLPKEKVISTFYYFFSEIIPENIPNLVNYTLSCADEVLVTDQAPLDSTFKRDTEHFYDATVENVDFSQTKKAATDINSFVKQRTKGKIHSIVNRVNPMSSSLLIDAVYFKGKWEKAFQSFQTLPGFFYESASQSDIKTVSFMHTFNNFPYTETEDYQAVELPYIGGNLCLLVILPRQRAGLFILENIITPEMIPNIRNQLQSTDVYISLPKFRLQFYRDFSKDFEELGAKSAYKGPADFSGMTSNKNLVVSGTLHKAVLEVGEEGRQSETVPNYTPMDTSTIFMANHPFMFAVVERKTNFMLFIGRLTNV